MMQLAVLGSRCRAWALALWEREVEAWRRVWARTEWEETLPLRFKVLTKAFQDQEKHVARVYDDLAKAERMWTKNMETMSKQREELRAAHETQEASEARCRNLEARCKALEEGKTLSGLSAAEVERLAQLMMASGKLAAEAAKVVLYGWAQPSPLTGRPKRVDLERGLGKVQALTAILVNEGAARSGEVRGHAAREIERISGLEPGA
jgi:hypothetical protein